MFSPQNLGVAGAGASLAQVRLIETTDLHLHLLPWDYYADRPAKGIGLASAAALIEAARAEVPNAFLFDNGDFLQGTPLGDWLAQDRGLRPGDLHPAIAAMNALGYDAIGLGNHEFNYGLDFLLRSLDAADCPVVSANLALSQGSGPRTDRHVVRPYALLDRMVVDGRGQAHPLRIGVLGLAPPQIVNWDRHVLGGRVQARDIVETARAFVPEMREAGADIVLALAHTGIGAARHSDGMENAAIPLARVPGIDALMTGHNHLIFPAPVWDGLPEIDAMAGTLAGKPAVMAGCWGAQIGVIDLLLSREGGGWQVLGARSEVRHVAQAAPAPVEAPGRVAAAVAPAHEGTLAAIRRPVAQANAPLHSYFTHLGRIDAMALIAQAQVAHVGPRLAEARPDLAGLPVLSAVAPFKCGGRGGPAGYTDVPAGPVALRHIADLYAFPNAIAAITVTGADVLDWLERAAAAFNRILPGTTETPLRDPAVAGYHFEVIEPLDVLYDLSQPSRFDAGGTLLNPGARRVVRALYEGRPVRPYDRFIMVTNSYRLGGAGGYVPQGVTAIYSDGTPTREALRAHVVELGQVTAQARGRLAAVPLPGTSALFETGPGAAAHLAEIAALSPEGRGTTRAGFLRLRVDLSNGFG